MEGKTVVLSVLILSLVLAQLQVDAKSCCPNTTARNIYNTCRLAGGSQSACASLSGCIHQTSSICRPPFPSEILESSVGCQKIPFLLCDRVCDSCVCDRRIPELAECTCAQWKPFGQLPKSEESPREVSLVSESVAKSLGGFIPYPECIEKCDECVICTLPLPIENALCYCGKKTETEGKLALPI